MANKAADNLDGKEEMVPYKQQLFARQLKELNERARVSHASAAALIRRALDFYFSNYDRHGKLKPQSVRLSESRPYERKKK